MESLFAHHILSMVLFTPLVGALLLLLIPRENEQLHKIAGNVFGVLGFLVSLPLIRWFRPGWGGFTFEETADWIPSIGAKYHLGIDGISLLLVMLLAILALYFYAPVPPGGTRSFDVPTLLAAAQTFADPLKVWLFWGFFFAFAIKVPMFPFHTWLPDAHTEAPTAGSVILAGVLLKMGTFGFIRFSLPLLPSDPHLRHKIIQIVIVLSLIGIVYGALVCLMQKDMKRLIAYSSVSHLGFCTLALFALTPNGLSGTVLHHINHTLSTGPLFFITCLP